MGDKALTIDDSILEHLARVPAYVAGKPVVAVAREHGIEPAAIIKLASNENPQGMSPLARQALAATEQESTRYPDMEAFELRAKLAALLELPTSQIILGAGSSELIQLAVRVVMAPQYAAVFSQYAFVLYDSAVRSVGARTIVVPARDWGHDLDQMLAAIEDTVRVVFIASPNNPTGTLVDAVALERFVAAVPAHILVILDEAYRDFVDASLRPDVGKLLARHRNLLVVRTFSKVHGLAGLRVGYGMGDPAIISVIKRLQLPFSVGVQGQAAAMAALDSGEFVAATIAANAVERDKVADQLRRLKFEYVNSFGNFILVRVGDGPEVFRQLLRFGIVIRPVSNYGLPQWIRVSIGLSHENAAFLQQLAKILPNGSPAV